MLYSAFYRSPVGKLTIASDGENIAGLWIEGQKYFGAALLDELYPEEGLPVFDMAKEWLARYFEGKRPDPAKLPLKPMGGEFRQMIWKELCGIPYGKVTTYGAIAKRAGEALQRRMSAQAVGGAVAHNPISIMIPCHRVVGANGSLTGYAGGLDVKKALLELEGVDLSCFFEPKKGMEQGRI